LYSKIPDEIKTEIITPYISVEKDEARISVRIKDSLKDLRRDDLIKKIIKLKDPTNIVLDSWKRPNGLSISKVSIPIGVIGIIYESRPNVTSDVASLCFKSGNAAILKGGSEAFYSNLILSKLFRKSLSLSFTPFNNNISVINCTRC